MAAPDPGIAADFVDNINRLWTLKPECAEHGKGVRCHCKREIVRTKPLKQWLNWEGKKPGSTNGAELLCELQAKFEARLKKAGLSVPGVYADTALLLEDGSKSQSVLVLSCLVVITAGLGYVVTFFNDCEITDATFLHESVASNTKLRLRFDAAGISKVDQDWITSNFDEKKWAFCPATLDEELLKGKRFQGGLRHMRLPFCSRDSIRGTGGQAKVRRVTVHEDFIGHELIEKLGPPTKKGKFKERYYHFALKSYSAAYHEEFEAERDAFKGLQKAPGIVRYFGSFTHHDGIDTDVSCYYLLLELGGKNLYQYFETQNPPVLPEEIIDTWKTISESARGLKSVHEIKYRAKNLNGWHGDVKPENLLFVGEELKLTDFGFFSFADGKTLRNKLPGNTRTYAPPDRDLEKLQTFDTWSYGCVLSVAATWFVVGTTGLANFELHRHQACQKANGPWNQGEPVSDQFHDGKTVLVDIRDWHNQLRAVMRPSDFVTSRILELVDKNLLLEDPQVRLTSGQLCTRLDSIIKDAETFWRDPSRQSIYQWTIPKILERSRERLMADSGRAFTAQTLSEELEDLMPTPQQKDKTRKESHSVRVSLLVSEKYRKAEQEGHGAGPLQATIPAPDGPQTEYTLQLNLLTGTAARSDRAAQTVRETSHREGALGRQLPSVRISTTSSTESLGHISDNASPLAVPLQRAEHENGLHSSLRTEVPYVLATGVDTPISNPSMDPKRGPTLEPSTVASSPGRYPSLGPSGSVASQSSFSPYPTRSQDMPSAGLFPGHRSSSLRQQDIWALVRSEDVFADRQIRELLGRDPAQASRKDPTTKTTPIILAAQLLDAVKIEALLDYSDLSAQDGEGKTLLHHLVLARESMNSPKGDRRDNQYHQILMLILEKSRGGGLLNILDSDGHPALFYCLTSHGTEMLKTTKCLVKAELEAPTQEKVSNEVRRKVLQEAVNSVASLEMLRALEDYSKDGDWLAIDVPRNLSGAKKDYVAGKRPKKENRKSLFGRNK